MTENLGESIPPQHSVPSLRKTPLPPFPITPQEGAQAAVEEFMNSKESEWFLSGYRSHGSTQCLELALKGEEWSNYRDSPVERSMNLS